MARMRNAAFCAELHIADFYLCRPSSRHPASRRAWCHSGDDRAYLNPTDDGAKLIGLLRWPVLLVLVAVAFRCSIALAQAASPPNTALDHLGCRHRLLLWLLGSLGVSFYLSHVANFNATYGTLGALIGFLFWTWISTIVVILGAELNAELEHQTAKTPRQARRPADGQAWRL